MINLDIILVKCFFEILKYWDGNRQSGSVAAAIVSPNKPPVIATSYRRNNLWCHAERHVIEKYQNSYGSIPTESIMVTTLSPCFARMCDRDGMSCTDLIESLGISRVYTAIMDHTQNMHSDRSDLPFDIITTKNQTLFSIADWLCKSIEDYDNRVNAFEN